MSDTTTPTVPPEVLQSFSDAIAASIAARTDAQSQVVGHPVVELGEGTGLTGGFTLKITHGDYTYALIISVPSAAGQPYIFSVTMQKAADPKPTTLALFEFLDGSNWKVAVQAPQFSIGSVTINEVQFNLSDGVVPPPPT